MGDRFVWAAMALLGASALSMNGAHAAQQQGPACVFPDLSAVPSVALVGGASDPNGTGGPIPGGRWWLIELKRSDDLPISGQGSAELALDASSSSTGVGSTAFEFNGIDPVPMINETGAGPYLASGNNLSFTNDCGGALTLGSSQYSVDQTGPDPLLTLWGEIEIQILPDPFPSFVTVAIEALFQLIEPQMIVDPVFEDRFEPAL